MWKKISAVLIPTIIAAALIVFMLARVWDDLLVAVQHMIPAYLVAAILICLAAWYLRGWRYQYIIEKLGTKIGLNFSTACIYVSQTANLIIPARLGDFVRLFILKHEKGTPYTNGFTSVVAERVYDVIIIAVLGLFALPILISLVPAWFVWMIVFVLGAGAVFFLFLLLSRRLHAENKILKKILEVLDQLRQVSSTPGSLAALSVSSAVIWMMDVTICYLVSLMFGVTIPFMLVLLAIVIGNLVKAVPITPGGIGTYELALVITFEIGGVPAATATLIAVVDHLIKNLVTLAGGVVSLYYFGDWAVSLLKRLFREDAKKLKEEHGSS
ncbi:MAG: lysylphosphatidylglycerol synthase transmembrane domain-containing protein [Methanocorpusculum sp.]|nr:lysylphosphatidylglycerol synthase transmembrane domain-containing protein [Methanocorpusculum sp.]